MSCLTGDEPGGTDVKLGYPGRSERISPGPSRELVRPPLDRGACGSEVAAGLMVTSGPPQLSFDGDVPTTCYYGYGTVIDSTPQKTEVFDLDWRSRMVCLARYGSRSKGNLSCGDHYQSVWLVPSRGVKLLEMIMAG